MALAIWVVFSVISIFIFAALVSGLNQKTVSVPSDSFLVIDLNIALRDAPPEDDPLQILASAITGDDQERIGLWQAMMAIEGAAKDERIKGIIMIGSLFSDSLSGGYAALEELRNALTNFKNSDKPVYAYLENPSLKDYYLASVASEVWLHPMAEIPLAGLSSENIYLGDAFKKWGVGIQPLKVGLYKSAIEPLTESGMSPAAREQTTVLLDDLWNLLLTRIGHERGVERETLFSLSRSKGFIDADEAKAASLVDELYYKDEAIAKVLTVAAENEETHSFEQVHIVDYIDMISQVKGTSANALESESNGSLAIVYAEGSIIDGESQVDQIGGDTLSRELRKIRHDENIKAVILRVNSPGGSAFASEIIRRELELIAEKKTLVVSMGHLAASGGYWISTPAEKIFAEAQTITGSIGVFGILPNFKELAEKNSIFFDGVQTGPFADVYSIAKPATDAQIRMLQGKVENIYEQFIGLVAESRDLSEDTVKQIAEGRVWSGLRAKELGLVDDIGGLYQAVNYTLEAAQLPAGSSVLEYPRPQSPAEWLQDFLEGNARASFNSGTSSPIDHLKKAAHREWDFLNSLRDPHHIYARLHLWIE